MSGRDLRQSYLQHQLRVAAVAFTALFGGGTLAFWIVGRPEWSVFDALYMTVITVTTVGYEEVHPLGIWGRVVSILIILGGVGSVVYITGGLAESIIEGRVFWRRRMLRKIQNISDHFIVCGYGRVGRAICRELESQRRPHVIVDLEAPAEGDDLPMVVGDATDDDILLKAGIERARALVTVLGSDAENIYTVLAARALCPKLFIVSRCGEDRSMKKLTAAGADRVINPYDRGGYVLAQIMLRPKVLDFLEEVSRAGGLEIHMEQIVVGEGSPLAGIALRDSPIRSELDIIVTAIEKSGGQRRFNPSPNEVIEEGDVLIAMGRPSSLDALANRAAVRAERVDGIR